MPMTYLIEQFVHVASHSPADKYRMLPDGNIIMITQARMVKYSVKPALVSTKRILKRC